MTKRATLLFALALVACRNNLADDDRPPIDHEARARMHQTRVDLRLLQQSIELYRAREPKACPTFAALANEKLLIPNESLVDPWGNPYVIVCGAADDAVMSFGPDGEDGTHDDVWSPAGPIARATD